MSRRRISATERAKIFERARGKCHICGHMIDAGRECWDLEHIIPLAMGGDDHGDNLAPAHRNCHAIKTAEADAPALAKAKRLYRRHVLGVRTPSTFPKKRTVKQ
jgi:5-methylcytosine-specific restriction endonuclease McrA